jgi:DNA polymerase III subunit epsilon
VSAAPQVEGAARIVVLDTETTGLDASQGHRIIEIGCIEISERKVTTKTLHHYIDPERDIDPGAQAVHGISREDLAGKPRFADVAQEIADFITGAQIVIHNAAFDVGFLNAEFARLKMPPVATIAFVTDSLTIARAQFPGKRNSLDALCERLGVDNSGRTHHGALLDAQLLAEVYISLTRGQESLSIDFEETGQKIAAVAYSGTVQTYLASAEEITAHEAYLDGLAKKSTPIWRALTK